MSKRKQPPPPPAPSGLPLGGIFTLLLSMGIMTGGWALMTLADRSVLGSVVMLLGAAATSYAIERLLRRVGRLHDRLATRKMLGVLGAVVLSAPCLVIVLLYQEAGEAEIAPQLDVVSLDLKLDHRHGSRETGPSDLVIEARVKNTSRRPQPTLTAKVTLLDRKLQPVLQAEGPLSGDAPLAPGAQARLRLQTKLPAAALRTGSMNTTASPVTTHFVFFPRGKPQLQIAHTESWGTSFMMGSHKAGGFFYIAE